jgi:hypothetical protein
MRKLEDFAQSVLAAKLSPLYLSSGLCFIRRHKLFSSGKHKKTSLNFFFKKVRRFKYLSFGCARKTGCSRNGTKTIYSKSSLKKSIYLSYLKNLNGLKFFSMVLRYFREPSSIKVGCLLINSLGQFSVLPLTTKMLLFKFLIGANFMSIFFGTVFSYDFFDSRFCETVYFLRHTTAVCYISVDFGSVVKFVKSTNSTAAIYRIPFLCKHIYRTAVILPSGLFKQVDSSVCVLLGRILPKNKKNYKNTKAGF